MCMFLMCRKIGTAIGDGMYMYLASVLKVATLETLCTEKSDIV